MKTQIALLLATLGASALPVAQAADFEEFGRVTRVQPRVEQIRQPREECRTEYVQAPAYQAQAQPQQRSAGGAIVGALIGGLAGNQIGRGSGRAAATAVGAVAGAVVGDKVDNQGRPVQQYSSEYPQEQAVRQCRMVDAWESRTVGYDVTYDYRGRSYTSMMDRDPGQRVRLHVTVEPERMQ